MVIGNEYKQIKKTHIIDQRLLMRQRDFSQPFVVLLNIYYNAYKVWISQTVTNKIISK